MSTQKQKGLLLRASRTVDDVAKLVADAVDLLAVELDDNDGVVLQKFDVCQLDLRHVQQRRVCELALQKQHASIDSHSAQGWFWPWSFAAVQAQANSTQEWRVRPQSMDERQKVCPNVDYAERLLDCRAVPSTFFTATNLCIPSIRGPTGKEKACCDIGTH